jgi:hypothetical protein
LLTDMQGKLMTKLDSAALLTVKGGIMMLG